MLVNCNCIKISIILHQVEKVILFFLIKKTSIAIENFKGIIYLVHMFSTINTSNSNCSTGDKEYTLKSSFTKTDSDCYIYEEIEETFL